MSFWRRPYGNNPTVGGDPYHLICQEMSPAPDRTNIRVFFTTSGTGPDYIVVSIVAAPFQPEVHTMCVAAAATYGIDGSTTDVAASRADVGYKGLNAGTWRNQFLVNDAGAQTLADNIAKLNLEERTPIQISTKGNPRYDPWDIIAVTINSEYSAQNFEIIGINHTINLEEGGGGYSTRLTLRKWTA